MRGVRTGAAGLVLICGILLFTGYMAKSQRFSLF